MSSFQTDTGRWVRHGGDVIVLLGPAPRSTREPSSAEEMAAPAHETYSYGMTHWIQSSLNRITGRTLDVDGVIGPQTRAAIMDFQRSEGLRADGSVGPITTTALQAALARQSAGDYRPVPAAGGAGSAIDLKGAQPGLANYARDAARYGLRVSSGLRPKAKTSSGNDSYHGSGDAIDLAGAPSDMLRYARHAAEEYGHMLEELIHTPLGAAQIKNGRPHTYSAKVAADHHDHVHIADVDPTVGGSGGSGVRSPAADPMPAPALGTLPSAWSNGPVGPPAWRPTMRGHSSIACGPRSNGMVSIPDNLQPESVTDGWTTRTQAIVNLIRGPLFGWTSDIGGAADGGQSGHVANSYHYCGRAIDAFPPGVAWKEPAAGAGLRAGWLLANWAAHNAAALSISEVIFFGRIWTAARSSEGWRPYTHPGGSGDPDTLQHRDHVHISVY